MASSNKRKRSAFSAPTFLSLEDKNGNITDNPIYDDISSGSYGRVVKVSIRGKLYAIKIFQRGGCERDCNKEKAIHNYMHLQTPKPTRVCLEISEELNVSAVHISGRRYTSFMIFPYIPYDLQTFVFKYYSELTAETLVSLFHQIIDALEEIHNMDPPVVHNDLKPENILIDIVNRDLQNPNVYLADFGLATIGNEGHKAGTPYYMVPYQWGQTPENIPQNDLWSLACICVNLLTLHQKKISGYLIPGYLQLSKRRDVKDIGADILAVPDKFCQIYSELKSEAPDVLKGVIQASAKQLKSLSLENQPLCESYNDCVLEPLIKPVAERLRSLNHLDSWRFLGTPEGNKLWSLWVFVGNTFLLFGPCADEYSNDIKPKPQTGGAKDWGEEDADLTDLADLKDHLKEYERRYNADAKKYAVKI
jgi:serine/threonine protein kinase